MNAAEYNAKVRSSHRITLTLTLEVDIDSDSADGGGALIQVLQKLRHSFEVYPKVEERSVWGSAWMNRAEVLSTKSTAIQTIPMVDTEVPEEVSPKAPEEA